MGVEVRAENELGVGMIQGRGDQTPDERREEAEGGLDWSPSLVLFENDGNGGEEEVENAVCI